MSVELARKRSAGAPSDPAVVGATSDRERGRTPDRSSSVDNSDEREFFSTSTGWEPKGENSLSFALTEAGREAGVRGAVGVGRDLEVRGVGKGEGPGVRCNEDKGTSLTSSAVVLINVGVPISRSRIFLDPPLACDADLFCANFSFRHLKSENKAVDDGAGVVEALLACRT